MKKLLMIIAVLSFAVSAQAAIHGVAIGPVAPPAMLGPCSMTPFPLDPQGSPVTSVASPLGGVVGFSTSLVHVTVGAGWATWSHGYTGDVYYESTNLTLSLPSDTCAFYLYAEPNPFAVYNITATAQDGTQVTQAVDGSAGASGYGFWSCDTWITSIVVTSDASFGVGEFGISAGPCIPAPGALLLGGLGVSLVGWLRRRRLL